MGRSCQGLGNTWRAHSQVKRARDSQWVKLSNTNHTRWSNNINQVQAITALTSRQSSIKTPPGKLAQRCAKTSSLRSAEGFRLHQVSMTQTTPRSRKKLLVGASEQRSVRALSRKAMKGIQAQAHTPLPLLSQMDLKFTCMLKHKTLIQI